jgi:chromate transporter
LGFVPAVTAIIIATAWNMGKMAVKSPSQATLAVAAFACLLSFKGFAVTASIVAGAGICGWLLFRGRPGTTAAAQRTKTSGTSRGAGGTVRDLASVAVGAAPLLSLDVAAAGKLFAVFAGMSVFLFGGGYVFIPLIQKTVVEGHGWVTQQEFIDAIALGQVTPGPILISAAFIGYKVAGLIGAIAATVGIYTPPTLIMILSTRFLDTIKQSKHIQASLVGVRSAVIGMIAAAALVVGRTAPLSWPSLLIFVSAAIALFRFRLEAALIIPVAGVAGYFLY